MQNSPGARRWAWTLGRVNYAVKYRRLWLTYLAVLLVALAIGVVVGLSSALEEGALLREAIGTIVSILYLVPLYGYVMQKPIGRPWMWSTVLIVAGTAILVLLSFAALGGLQPVLYWAAMTVLLIPNLFAIHQYVHDRHIWNAT